MLWSLLWLGPVSLFCAAFARRLDRRGAGLALVAAATVLLLWGAAHPPWFQGKDEEGASFPALALASLVLWIGPAGVLLAAKRIGAKHWVGAVPLALAWLFWGFVAADGFRVWSESQPIETAPP